MKIIRLLTASHSRRMAAGLLVLASVVAVQGSAGADTQSKLNKAQQQLSKLESVIASQVKQAEAVRANLVTAESKVGNAQQSFNVVTTQLISLRAELSVDQSQYDELQGHIDALARQAYEEGPGASIENLLSATSMNDLNDRMEFMSVIGNEDKVLATQVQGLTTSLDAQKTQLDGLQAKQAVVLSQLTSAQDALGAKLSAQETALANLNATRDKIVKLIGQLSAKLQGQTISGVGGILQGGHNAPYGEWAAAFLQRIQAPACFDNMVAMVAWQVQEGTTANWNPLATTYPEPGASDFNSVGVKNYVSLAQGLDATYGTLNTSAYGYPPILSSLRACKAATTTAWAINASSWCRGCAGGRYEIGLISTVEANYSTYSKL
jgi:peptidoglycan hydrolase CwlO-like protein